MIGTLQALRALAALSVLYYHSGYAAFGAHTDIGGVALFFVISGFLSCHIMTTDPTRNGCTFFLRRIKRIAPLYWLATFLILFLAARPSSVPYEHIALSLLFVPHDSVYGAFPVHGVGWTLNIEMACYGLFALSIWLAPAHAPLIAIGLILTVRATVSALASPNTAVALHANALYAEAFVAAIIVWLAWNANRGRIEQWNAPGWLFPAATAVYVVTVVAARNSVSRHGDWSRRSVNWGCSCRGHGKRRCSSAMAHDTRRSQLRALFDSHDRPVYRVPPWFAC